MHHDYRVHSLCPGMHRNRTQFILARQLALQLVIIADIGSVYNMLLRRKGGQRAHHLISHHNFHIHHELLSESMLEVCARGGINVLNERRETHTTGKPRKCTFGGEDPFLERGLQQSVVHVCLCATHDQITRIDE